ncbi:MAG: glycosyltransferase family A protein [Acidimicrobiia bacterium]
MTGTTPSHAFPHVTVGMPVFNGEPFLAATLDSVLSLDYPAFDVVVSDNASTDSTLSLLRDRAGADPRLRIVTTEINMGAGWNFNRVLELAEGKYFHWAGADDLMDRAFLSRCVNALEENPGAVLSYPRTMLIDADGEETGEFPNRLELADKSPSGRLRRYIRNIRLANPIFGVIRTEELKEAGGLGTFPSADLLTLGRLAIKGKFIEVDQVMFYRRMHEGQSWQGAGGHEGFAAWFDPLHPKRVVFPSWRLLGEFLRTSVLADIGAAEKLRCVLVVLVEWPRRRWRQMIGELTRTRRILFRRAPKV